MIELITEVVNALGLLLFIILTTLAVARMAWRVSVYLRSKRHPSVILRRDLLLLGAFLAIFGEVAVLRFLGVTLDDGSVERLLFIVQSNLIGLGAIGYWVKVEYFDIDDPSVE